MNKNLLQLWICAIALVTIPSFASDSRIAQSQRERHEHMQAYFSTKGEPYPDAHCFWNRTYMTGNWGGVRNTLADVGITFDFSYVTDMLGNPVGGKARGFAYDGSFGASMNVDFTKAGWKGFNLFSSACWRTGTNLSRKKIDNQFTVSQLYGSQTVRLNELYLLQNLFEKRLTLKAGRLDGGNDFLNSPLYWQYVNNAFDGNPVGIFYNVPFTAYPNATWGAVIGTKPWNWLSAKFAIYNANSKIQLNKYHGTNFTFSNTNGVLLMTEWGALINQSPCSHGMPGNYKVGYFYLTGEKEKFSGGEQKGDPGVYFLFDQMIYRQGDPKCDRGLTPFITVLLQPKNRNQFPFFTNGGLVYKGPFGCRPQDVAAFGVAYGRYSPDLARVQRNTGVAPQKAETVLELNYWFQINKWFYVMPDMQYIITPKGVDSTPNAYVIGFQLGLDQW